MATETGHISIRNVIDPEHFSLEDYLGETFHCACGKIHTSMLGTVSIKRGAIRMLPGILNSMGVARPFIFCDQNTWEAAGEQVNNLLQSDFPKSSLYRLDSRDVVPNEATLGELIMACPSHAELIIGVGTGTINDLAKYISFRLGLPYIIVATAPSMDGFASVGAALITDSLKTTYDAHVPTAIIGDIDILMAAPMEMIISGLCDILGKYTCLLDWQLAHLVTGEYYCGTIAAMVHKAIDRVLQNVAGIKSRSPQAVAAVMEALVLTGIAMSFVGNSRPASGSEHHLSHYWEMLFILEGRKPILHGITVGIGTVLSSYLYHILLTFKPDFEAAERNAENFDRIGWNKNIERAFSKAAPAVIALEDCTQKNGITGYAQRLEVIRKHWDEILQLIELNLPQSQEIMKLLSSLQAPVTPAECGIAREAVVDSILFAKEVRNRYTVLQLLWDIGVLDKFSTEAVDWLENIE